MPKPKPEFAIGERVRFNRKKFPLSSLPYQCGITDNETLIVTGFKLTSEGIRAPGDRRTIIRRQLLYLRYEWGREVKGPPNCKTPYGFDSEFFVKAA